MKEEMKTAQAKLQALLEAHPVGAGIYVRVHGKNLIVGRQEPFGPHKQVIEDDRLRLTKLSTKNYGLSVKRHTGRWQKSPFVGTLEKIAQDMLSYMQHLLMPYH